MVKPNHGKRAKCEMPLDLGQSQPWYTGVCRRRKAGKGSFEMPIATRVTAELATEPLNGAEVERIPDTAGRLLQDRRRPGRSEHVSPALIELLRSRANPDLLQSEDGEARSALGTAQGILAATVLGLLMWAGLVWLIGDLLR
jgi:hypothetical protein